MHGRDACAHAHSSVRPTTRTESHCYRSASSSNSPSLAGECQNYYSEAQSVAKRGGGILVCFFLGQRNFREYNWDCSPYLVPSLLPDLFNAREKIGEPKDDATSPHVRHDTRNFAGSP